MSRRKGVLGGTFNPPHIAHLIVAHEVGHALQLDQVALVPTSRHPFKGEAAASPRDRAAMTELAVAGDPLLTADRVEIDRGGISYTVDTLRTLRAREPETEWYLILGRDNLAELDSWREAEALPQLAQIVVVTRGEHPGGQSPGGQNSGGQSPGGQSPGGQDSWGQSPGGQCPVGREPAPEPPFGGRYAFVAVPRLEISSTAVRQRVADGRSIRYWVPPGVEAYIREHGLYRPRPETG